MNRYQWVLSTIAILAAGNVTLGCSPGGVGDPCIPEDEYQDRFAGYGVGEVNVEAMSFQCETRLCLVNHFRGRVTCPYGQTADTIAGNDTAKKCKIADGKGSNFVKVEVDPQLLSRQASNSVYCSCRCAGPDKTARYCKCPSGYTCTVLNEIPLGASQLLGSYCVRNGAEYIKSNSAECPPDLAPDQCELNCVPGDSKTACDYPGYPKGVNPF
jgi:hypothetical protein